MRFSQQIAISLCVLVVGGASWLYFSPDGRDVLGSIGLVQLDRGKADGNEGGGRGRGGGGGRAGRGVQVVTSPVTVGTVNDKLTAIGSGVAIQSVTLLPEVSGMITEVTISSGDTVEKGQLIATLDNREQVLARDLAQIALESAQRQASINRKIKSSISDLAVYNTEIAEKKAQLALEAAQLALERRQIMAPFSGVAGIVEVNVGDYVTASAGIVTIDDRSSILVDFFVPEGFATLIKPGAPVEVDLTSAPQKIFEGEVEAVDNRIDATSRTFIVRARIDNRDDALRAGMSFNVTMRFPGDEYPAVDPLAVQWDSNGAFVWQVIDGKSVKSRIRIIQREPDYVLVDADIHAGDAIIIEGIQRLREGASVSLAKPAATQLRGVEAAS